jgi:hypothetical protein
MHPWINSDIKKIRMPSRLPHHQLPDNVRNLSLAKRLRQHQPRSRLSVNSMYFIGLLVHFFSRAGSWPALICCAPECRASSAVQNVDIVVSQVDDPHPAAGGINHYRGG